MPTVSPVSVPGFVMSGVTPVTAPLPTLAEIDGELTRAIGMRDLALADIAALMDDVAQLDESVDAMLECRSRVAALQPQ